MPKRIIIIILLSAILLGALVFFLSDNSPKVYKWIPELNHDKKEPYDFALLQELLKSNYKWHRIDQKEEIEKINESENDTRKGYIFAGHSPILSEKGSKEIIRFAENGAEVFFICHLYPDSVFAQLETVMFYDKLPSIISKTVKTGFYHPNFVDKKYDFSFKSSSKDTSYYKWSEIPNDICSEFQALGYFTVGDASEENFQTGINFIRIPVGRGFIYWHSNPLLFTNLYLGKSQQNGIEYLNSVLSHFNVEEWYWDFAGSKWSENIKEKEPPRFDKPKTPLQYIFSQPSLKTAWLILLVMTVLYLIFGAKRKQRVIPIIEMNRNTSLEFIKTIARLYFQQQSHKVIFNKQMQLFRSHLRRKYSIILKDDDLDNEDVVKNLVKKTDLEAYVFTQIFNFYNKHNFRLNKKGAEMSSETLNQFYLLLEMFYEKEKERKLKKNNTDVTEN